MDLAVHGTPADAVRVGIKFFQSEESPIDLVVSGINEGPNLGTARSSGTVGAAFKALEMGIPSIAISSQINKDYSMAARYAAKIIAQIKERGPLKDTVLSINVPGGEIHGVMPAPASISGAFPYVIDFDISPVTAEDKDQESFLLSFRGHWAPDSVKRKNSNTYYFAKKNYITITPLKHDPTDYEALCALGLWDLEP